MLCPTLSSWRMTSFLKSHLSVPCVSSTAANLQAHPEPWGGKEDRGVFSSTLSFLENVRPSERFSPLENSLTTPKTLPGASLDYPLSDASTGRAAGPHTLSAIGTPSALPTLIHMPTTHPCMLSGLAYPVPYLYLQMCHHSPMHAIRNWHTQYPAHICRCATTHPCMLSTIGVPSALPACADVPLLTRN